MPADWPSFELGQLVEPDRGISYGIVQPGQPTANGVPIVRVADVRNGRINTNAPMRVARSIEAAYSRTRLRGGELLITIVGTIGETAIVPNSLAGWNVARAIAVLPVQREIGAYWVRLALRASQARDIIHSRLNTTVQATLNLGDLAKLPILTPPQEDRQRIASVLGALDDKIDLNRRMNETLEAMARAIFKDWFIDFGPTRAKMEGRAPYLVPDLWALFPDRLEDNGKPDRWDACDLSDLVELNPSERLPKATLAPYIDMAALPVRGSWPDAPILREAGSGSRFRNGDTLFARITPCLENGKTAYVTSLRAGEVAWGSTEFIVIRSRPPVPPEFAYLLARDESFRAHAIQSMTGTSGRQRVQFEALRTFGMVRASDDVLRAFGALVSAKFQKIASNAKECEVLAATRDLLLPKLMSGEIRVRQAEKVAEAFA